MAASMPGEDAGLEHPYLSASPLLGRSAQKDDFASPETTDRTGGGEKRARSAGRNQVVPTRVAD